MSSLSRLRVKIKYRTDVQRCSECAHYKKPHTFLIDSLPKTSKHECKLYGFNCAPNALCDSFSRKEKIQ